MALSWKQTSMNSAWPQPVILRLHLFAGQGLGEPHKFMTLPQHVCLKESDLEAYSPKVLWFITCDRQGEILNMARVYCCNSTDIRHLSSTTIGTLKYLYLIIEFLTIFKCISLPNDFMRSGRTVTVRKGNKDGVLLWACKEDWETEQFPSRAIARTLTECTALLSICTPFVC